MKQFIALLIVLLALVAAAFSAGNGATGIRAIVRKAGLNEVIKDVLPIVLQQAHDVKIDDISGSQHVAVVGDVDYKLTNITVTKVEVNSFEVNMTAPNAVGVVVSGLTVGLGLKWSYQLKGWPHTAGNGDASATAAGSSSRISVIVTVVNGKPVLKADVVSISLGNLDVKISGGTAGWILNLLEGLFKGTIKSAAEQGISAAITQSINVVANDQIQKANFVVPIPKVPLEFDATLSEDIVVNSDYLVFGDKAEMYNSQTHQEPPFAPVELPSTPTTADTLEVHVADFVANAAGFAAFTAGILKVNVTPEEVPASSPIKLNTTDLKYMIPELYAKYPDMGIQLSIVALRAPLVKFAADGASGVVNGSITFFVFDKTTPLTHAFTMGVVMSAKLTDLGVISTESQFSITLQIADPSVDLSLISTSIGPVDVSTLQSTIKVVVIAGFLPQLNKKLKAGIPIDLPKGLVIQNPVVKLNSGFVSIAGDITYTAPSSLAQLFAGAHAAHASDKKEHIKRVATRIHELREELSSLEEELQHLVEESFDAPEVNTESIIIN